MIKKTLMLILLVAAIFVTSCTKPLSEDSMEACVSDVQDYLDTNKNENSTYTVLMYKSFKTIADSKSWKEKYDKSVGKKICDENYGPVTSVVIKADTKIQDNFWNSYAIVVYCNKDNKLILDDSGCN